MHSPQKVETALIDNFPVPVYATGEEQLRHAWALPTSRPDKKAWLKAVTQFHQADRHSTGVAALGLAYLELGLDHRLAEKYQAKKAIAALNRILREYETEDDIISGALWYIGWIYTDILNDPVHGIENYQRVLAHQTSTFFVPRLSVRWPSLEQVANNQEISGHEFQYSWKNLAGLQVIRYSQDRDQAWQALRELSPPADELPAGYIEGKALLLFFKRFKADQKSRARLDAYLNNAKNPELIQKDLSYYRSPLPEAVHR